MKKFIALFLMTAIPSLANAAGAGATLSNFTFSFTGPEPTVDLNSFSAITQAFTDSVYDDAETYVLPASYSFDLTASAIEANSSAYADADYSPTDPLSSFKSAVYTTSGTAVSVSAAYITINYIAGTELVISADAHIMGAASSFTDYSSSYGYLFLTNLRRDRQSMLYSGFGDESYDLKETLYLTYYSNKNETLFFSAATFAQATAQPVPEPETYAMLLAGLGLMGYVVRYRKV